jgi:hypothetical protein
MNRILKPLGAAAAILFAVLVSAPSLSAADSSPNDRARFLAGLAPAEGSPLAEKAKDAGWKRHATAFDKAWEKLNNGQLGKIRAWQTKNLTSPQPNMYYMFSGPDFLYAEVFFPTATTYVMSGLEPIGEVPELATMSDAALNNELRDLQSALSNVLNLSFFITKNMQSQLKAGKVRGVLPVIYTFLARAGKTIEEVSLINVDADGNAQPSDGQAMKDMTPGVKIVFSGGASGAAKQTIYYFTTDLSNSGIEKSGFMKFCEKLGRGDGFVKSASYLMHSDGFSKVRDFLLQNVNSLVQDDSGIPLKYFQESDWDLHPHGKYLGPIKLFAGNYQSKLAALFKKGAQPIDFGIGYRHRRNESNLLLAVRKQAKAAAAN